MLRLIAFTLLTGITVAQLNLPCVVCIHGGNPSNAGALVPGTTYSCQYVNENVYYLSQPCYLAQDAESQSVCGCPGAPPVTRSDKNPGAVVPVPATPPPVKAKVKSPVKAPVKSPVKAPVKSPVKAPSNKISPKTKAPAVSIKGRPTPSPVRQGTSKGTPSPAKVRHYTFVAGPTKPA